MMFKSLYLLELDPRVGPGSATMPESDRSGPWSAPEAEASEGDGAGSLLGGAERAGAAGDGCVTGLSGATVGGAVPMGPIGLRACEVSGGAASSPIPMVTLRASSPKGS